ncbi:MAG: hypothetical protein FJ042_01905 [Candidatus Cloacimonetes bacterium]|nr:hypothetical protein [Candidatus Cloacimonadota bacterium]
MDDVLDKLQLLHFFLISYLISRVFVTQKLPERLVWWLFEKKHISLSRLVWLLTIGTGLLSMIIANVITLLTLLPLVILIQNDYKAPDKEHRKFSTLILLAVVWGANIGGTGMLTGTTTNGILIGMFELNKFEIRHAFTFLSWMAWGMPLVILLCGLGWLILVLVFKPNQHLSVDRIRENLTTFEVSLRLQKIGIILSIVFVISSAVLSLAMSLLKNLRGEVYLITSIWSFVFLYFIFFKHYRSGHHKDKVKLLNKEDIFHDLPKKGLLWILLGLGVTAILVALRFPTLVSHWTVEWLKADYSILLLYLIVALIVTFVTEIVSNSVIQISMFLVLLPLSKMYPEISWQMLLVITLCSTCAFMSPLATPSNGLGYGSSSRISLRHMLAAGFVMNIFSAGLITLWVNYCVPLVLRLFI